MAGTDVAYQPSIFDPLTGGQRVALGKLAVITGTMDAVANWARPANTTAYTANDALSDNATAGSAHNLVFANAARGAGMGGDIVGAVFVGDDAPATPGIFDLYVFDTAPVGAEGDNTAFAATDAESLTCIAVIPFTTARVGTVNTVYNAVMENTRAAFVTVTGNLWGKIAVRNAYTPASGGKFQIRLIIRQD